MCPYFFSQLPMPLFFFLTKLERERPTQKVEHLFCGMSRWYNANFSKKHSRGVCGVHVNLEHESMTKISLKGHNNLTKLNARQAAYVYKVFKIYHHMALVGLWHIKEELAKSFLNFQIRFPST